MWIESASSADVVNIAFVKFGQQVQEPAAAAAVYAKHTVYVDIYICIITKSRLCCVLILIVAMGMGNRYWSSFRWCTFQIHLLGCTVWRTLRVRSKPAACQRSKSLWAGNF